MNLMTSEINFNGTNPQNQFINLNTNNISNNNQMYHNSLEMQTIVDPTIAANYIMQNNQFYTQRQNPQYYNNYPSYNLMMNNQQMGNYI
jgi:hypothetical protein